MKEITKIKTEVIFWSFVFNPGAVILGLCTYSLALPESAIPEILGNRSVNYLFLAVGLAMVAVSGWRVNSLHRRRKELLENT